MAKYKADGYVRLSYTNDKSNESDSVINQKNLIEDFIKSNPDIELADIKVDDGYSGIIFDRPSFIEMMQDIKDGKVNCIIVKDLSRLGREFTETSKYLRREFPKYGIRFIAITDNIDTAKEAVTENLTVSFKGLINDEYCRDISVKTRTALNAKRKNGEYIGACPVYGYKKADNNKNQLVIDEYAANVVKDIFKMRIDGLSAAKIADELNRLSILSPSEYKKNHNMPIPKGGYADKDNSKWSATTIIRILKDEVYTGRLIQGKKGTPNYKIKEIVDRSPDEMFVTENAHEAIISKNDFSLAGQLMNIDTRISPVKDSLHLFSGILICGCCGNRMTRKTVTYKGNKYFYYYCPTGKKNGCNGSNMLKESDLTECVLKSIKAHIKSVASLNTLIDSVSSNAINKGLVKKYTERIKDLHEQLEKCNRFKARLYENFVSGVLSKDDYRDLKQQYTNDGKRIENAVDDAEKELDECKNNTSKRLQWIESFKQFENISELSRKVVVSIIKSIHIFDKQTIEITFNYNDDYNKAVSALEEMKEAM